MRVVGAALFVLAILGLALILASCASRAPRSGYLYVPPAQPTVPSLRVYPTFVQPGVTVVVQSFQPFNNTEQCVSVYTPARILERTTCGEDRSRRVAVTPGMPGLWTVVLDVAHNGHLTEIRTTFCVVGSDDPEACG